jgi:uncharacterized protein
MSEPLLIAGGSARAAAQSAVRAGFRVTAADMFGDRDLCDCAQAIPVADYPQGIAEIAAQIPPSAWLYTGGLENEPALVDTVSQRHHLLGHPGAVLRQVRDPWQLNTVLQRAGLRFPRPQRRPPSDSSGAWLRKPVASCGGARIERYRPTATGEMATTAGGMYYQPLIRGSACGAVFLGARGRATLLGLTRQLIGCAWAGTSGFRYVGSVGPIACDEPTRSALERIGNCLAQAFGLCGLFGVDAIVAGSDVWTVEVNPRYTASVEVIERATGVEAITVHREACRRGELPRDLPPPGDGLHGKAIVYARHDGVIGPDFYSLLDTYVPAVRGAVADLPPIGTSMRTGQPVLTVFARGRTLAIVHRALRARVGQLHALLASVCAARRSAHEPHR